MAQHDLLFDSHIISGLTPVADAFAGGVATDVISMANYRRATFIVFTGAYEDAAVSNLVTIEACDDAAASTTAAMAFKHRHCASSASVDTWGALTSATSAGYNFTSNNTASNGIWMATVTADEVSANGGSGYQFVRMAIAETANKTITAGVLIILSEPRYPTDVPVTAIA